jgi:hypothetical protein
MEQPWHQMSNAATGCIRPGDHPSYRRIGAFCVKPGYFDYGALTGIGRAASIAFAKAGANIVLSGRRDDEGQKLTAELRSLGQMRNSFGLMCVAKVMSRNVVRTKRRVYAPDPNKQRIPDPASVTIDIREISFSAEK